jgi:hypothetical protein
MYNIKMREKTFFHAQFATHNVPHPCCTTLWVGYDEYVFLTSFEEDCFADLLFVKVERKGQTLHHQSRDPFSGRALTTHQCLRVSQSVN